MTERAKLEAETRVLLGELEAARSRISQAKVKSRGGELALKAFALCDEIERLCQAATLSTDPIRVKELLARSQQHLDELQKLLGLH